MWREANLRGLLDGESIANAWRVSRGGKRLRKSAEESDMQPFRKALVRISLANGKCFFQSVRRFGAMPARERR